MRVEILCPNCGKDIKLVIVADRVTRGRVHAVAKNNHIDTLCGTTGTTTLTYDNKLVDCRRCLFIMSKYTTEY